MVDIKPFKGLRPRLDLVEKVAALPYDVSSEEEVKSKRVNPFSFYHITRSEIDITTGARLDSEEVYQKAKENLQRFIAEGTLVQDAQECYYLYSITMNGRTQTGLVCISSLSDYENGVIKKHEFTRPSRVLDRVNNILATQSHNGLVFLAYKENASLTELFEQWKKEHQAEYDFVAEDGVGHTFWVIDDGKTIDIISQTFREKVDSTYIADGHHRSAAAFEAAEKLAKSDEITKYYLTCIFPDTEVYIMDYNRIVRDLNDNNPEDILRYLTRDFDVIFQETAFKPTQEHEFGMYLAGKWYCLKAKHGTYDENDAISVLDVSILQENVLSLLFNIEDPRLDERLDFVGGIRGLSYLQQQVDSGKAAVAFSCFPVTMKALFEVSDKGDVMPPKSTWFEPKTRDGLVIHLIS